MANSSSPVPQVQEGTNAVRKINELNDAGSTAYIGGRDAATSALLVWGILGGRINGANAANATVTLTANATNYVVMAKATLVCSVSTATTNWNDSSNYWRLYSVVTGALTASSWLDERFSTSGIFPLGGSTLAGGSTTQVQYNSSGTLAGSATFTWDTANNRLNITNLTTTGIVITAASATGGAGFRLPHGAAPSAPVNGDVWTDTSGLYARINGATVGPFATSAGSLSNPMTTVGDLIVGGTVTGGVAAPVRLAMGTALQNLRVNTAGTALEFGGSNSLEASFVPPATTGWSWFNQGAATVTSNSLEQVVQGGATGTGASIRGRLRTMAATTNYTITARFRGLIINKSFQSFGLVLNLGSTYITFDALGITTPPSVVRVAVFNGVNTFGSTYITVPVSEVSDWWFRVKDDGTNRIYSLSRDGIYFTEILTHARTTGVVPTSAGIVVGTENSATPNFAPICRLLSWEETTP